jgi:hypothetical protein
MNVPRGWPQVLEFFGTPLVIDLSAGQLSGEAGLLPIRQFDERIALTRGLAEALDDPRDPDLTEHSCLEMVRSRVYGILAGYADQNDHDTLRADPVFKLLADRSPEDDDREQGTVFGSRCPSRVYGERGARVGPSHRPMRRFPCPRECPTPSPQPHPVQSSAFRLEQ